MVIDTSTCVPGVAEEQTTGPGQVKVSVGVASTLNIAGTAFESPELPVTVIEYGFPVVSAPERTMNEPLTTPEVDTLQLGDVMIFGVDPAEVEVMTQLVSIPAKPVP